MALVQSTTNSVAGSTPLVLTLNGASASNTLVLLIASNIAITGGLSGWTAGNVPAVFGATAVNGVIYYKTASAGTNTVSLTDTALGTFFAGACLLEWSGMAATPLDVAPAASNITAGGTSGTNSIASGTLGQASEVIFTLICTGTNGAGLTSIGLTDPPTGFTSLYAQQNSQANQCWEMAYQIVAATTTTSAAWTWTDTTTIDSQATLASFKLSGGTNTTVNVSAGTYSYTGEAATLQWNVFQPYLLASAGIYNYTGAQAQSTATLIASSGFYGISGENAQLNLGAGIFLNAASGSYGIVGGSVTFLAPGPPPPLLPGQIRMPKLIGMEYFQALALLGTLGLPAGTPVEMKLTQGPASTKGFVVGQSVAAGVALYPNTLILLTVNQPSGQFPGVEQNSPIPYWYFYQP